LRDCWEGILCSGTGQPSMNKLVYNSQLHSFSFLTKILMQIVLYVVSRVVASFIPRSSSPYSTSASPPNSPSNRPLPPDSRYFSLFAALSWGAVMWLFKNRAQTIQPGMFNSMTYLYRDSEIWRDLRTLLWHNT
jgi:peroxisomal membrane protein 4